MKDQDQKLLMTDGQHEVEKDDTSLYKSAQNLIDSAPVDLEDEGCICSFIPKRYLVAFLAMFGFFNAYAQRVNLSVAMVAMVNNVSQIGHALRKEEIAEFNWDTKLQGIVLGSFFGGYITTQIPGGYLSSKYGGKSLFGGGVLFSSILTLLTPVATRTSVFLLIALRVLEGISQGVVYSSNHTVMSRWAPVLERCKMVAFTTSGSNLGTVVTLPVSGILVKWYGWPTVFYFFGVLGILWSFLWFLMVTDSPSDHPKISKNELKYIESSLNGESTNNNNASVPWKDILTSGPVWAIVAAHFSQNWGFYTLLTTLPTYLKKVLDIELLATGFLSSLPYLLMTVVLYLAGLTSDVLRSKGVCSTTCVRKFFVCTGFFFQAIFLVCVGYARNESTAVTLLSLGVGMGGLIWSGFGVNHIDIAPRYSGLLMGISNCFATIPGIIGPPIAGLLTPNETGTEWRMVFYISGGVSFVGLLVYCLLGSGEKQSWNGNGYEVVPTSPSSSSPK